MHSACCGFSMPHVADQITTAAQSCLPDHEQNATTTAERPVVLAPLLDPD